MEGRRSRIVPSGGLEGRGGGGGYHFRVIMHEWGILYSIILWQGGLKANTNSYYLEGRGRGVGSALAVVKGGVQLMVVIYHLIKSFFCMVAEGKDMCWK